MPLPSTQLRRLLPFQRAPSVRPSPLRPIRGLALFLTIALASSPALAETVVKNRRIRPNQPLSKALRDAGLEPVEAERVVSALSKVFDPRKSRDNDQLRLVFQNGQLTNVDYRQSAEDEWQVLRTSEAPAATGNELTASRRTIETEKSVALVELAIESSLYEAARAANENPNLVLLLADVFAWDIDFYRDVQSGDRARMLVEKVTSRGRLLRYGAIQAASYEGSTVGKKRVFRYELPSGDKAYFLEDGSAAQKTFLKSPLKFANVTSRFGKRFHPVLQYMKAHNGVDYGAPVGTPVWAVADGQVTRAGWDRGGGNTLCIRHSNGFETCYLHLSKFGAGVRTGARVRQKQVVALSGNTGMSTGPHLHYALKRGGAYVNPLAQKFPRAEPVPKELRADFEQHVQPLFARLLPSEAPVAKGGTAASASDATAPAPLMAAPAPLPSTAAGPQAAQAAHSSGQPPPPSQAAPQPVP